MRPLPRQYRCPAATTHQNSCRRASCSAPAPRSLHHRLTTSLPHHTCSGCLKSGGRRTRSAPRTSGPLSPAFRTRPETAALLVSSKKWSAASKRKASTARPRRGWATQGLISLVLVCWRDFVFVSARRPLVVAGRESFDRLERFGFPRRHHHHITTTCRIATQDTAPRWRGSAAQSRPRSSATAWRGSTGGQSTVRSGDTLPPSQITACKVPQRAHASNTRSSHP